VASPSVILRLERRQVWGWTVLAGLAWPIILAATAGSLWDSPVFWLLSLFAAIGVWFLLNAWRTELTDEGLAFTVGFHVSLVPWSDIRGIHVHESLLWRRVQVDSARRVGLLIPFTDRVRWSMSFDPHFDEKVALVLSHFASVRGMRP
jgi:hypothetical protein